MLLLQVGKSCEILWPDCDILSTELLVDSLYFHIAHERYKRTWHLALEQKCIVFSMRVRICRDGHDHRGIERLAGFQGIRATPFGRTSNGTSDDSCIWSLVVNWIPLAGLTMLAVFHCFSLRPLRIGGCETWPAAVPETRGLTRQLSQLELSSERFIENTRSLGENHGIWCVNWLTWLVT